MKQTIGTVKVIAQKGVDNPKRIDRNLALKWLRESKRRMLDDDTMLCSHADGNQVELLVSVGDQASYKCRRNYEYAPVRLSPTTWAAVYIDQVKLYPIEKSTTMWGMNMLVETEASQAPEMQHTDGIAVTDKAEEEINPDEYVTVTKYSNRDDLDHVKFCRTMLYDRKVGKYVLPYNLLQDVLTATVGKIRYGEKEAELQRFHSTIAIAAATAALKSLLGDNVKFEYKKEQ